jgi:alkylated DNA repair dioxygenase AlkB
MNHELTLKDFSQNLLPENGKLFLIAQALKVDEADFLMACLQKSSAWRTENISLFGRSVQMPRQIAWQGEKPYTYSGVTHPPAPWSPEVLRIKEMVEALAGARFNAVLLNYYRDGRDSMGWHSDDERSLGPEPLIASVSLGAARVFQVRRRDNHRERFNLMLPHGSCLLMGGEMQRYWQHALPKTAKPVGPRVNLTFRVIC